MSLSFPGFFSPAAGPEAPLQMLAACHTRVEKQCRTLERLQAHLPKHGSDGAAQEAATQTPRERTVSLADGTTISFTSARAEQPAD